jgi:hypothetical protein
VNHPPEWDAYRCISETIRIRVVLFGMQHSTLFVPYLAAIQNGIFTPVMMMAATLRPAHVIAACGRGPRGAPAPHGDVPHNRIAVADANQRSCCRYADPCCLLPRIAFGRSQCALRKLDECCRHVGHVSSHMLRASDAVRRVVAGDAARGATSICAPCHACHASLQTLKSTP